MKHLGDITKINGADAPVVNVIIGGSPCQDLSVAGKRAGLAGERSGLFMEQIRIIKEMREADEARGRTDEHIRPRFMVWENVPGAFSSNGGADFGAVLQETVKVVCREAPPIPMFGKGWPPSGCLADVEGKWSVAWRVFDAQFWGVPQRRRRIALVADFGGQSAPEILFERKSVSRNFEESGTEGQGITTSSEKNSIGKDKVLSNTGGAVTLKIRSGCEGGGKGALMQYEKSATLSTHPDQTLFQPISENSECLTPWDVQSRRIIDEKGKWPALYGGEGGGHGYVMQSKSEPTYCIQGNCIDRADTAGCNGKGWTEDMSYTLNTIDRPAVVQSVPLLDDQGGGVMKGNDFAKVAPTLRAQTHGNLPIVAVRRDE